MKNPRRRPDGKGREVISPGHPEDFVLPDLGTAFAEMDEDPRLTEKDKLRRKMN